jgi:hypothetical protein
MAPRKNDTELLVQATFEATRTAAQCLSAAYERLVPIPRRAARTVTRSESAPDAVAVVEAPWRRRVEHE